MIALLLVVSFKFCGAANGCFMKIHCNVNTLNFRLIFLFMQKHYISAFTLKPRYINYNK